MKKLFLFIGLFIFLLSSFVNAEVTIASWGGAYTESQIKAYKDTYKDPSSINFINYNGGLKEVRAQVENGNVKWDLIDVMPDQAIQGCDEGLFENISKHYKKFPRGPGNTSLLKDMAMTGVNNLSDCCAPQIFWSYVVFYDPDAFSGPKPSTVADFFDVEKFPGKRGMHTWANANVEMALLADGVKPNAVYNILENQSNVIDKVFNKLDKIKDNVVFWSSGPKPLELVKSGEVVMAIAYNGRVGAANLSEGENFEYIWDSQVLEQEFLCLVSGSSNRKEALDFLKHASSPQSLALQARYITYGPMRASSVDIIAGNEPWFHTGVNVMQHMPNTPERLKISVMADPVWWFNNGAEIHDRYNAWMNN